MHGKQVGTWRPAALGVAAALLIMGAAAWAQDMGAWMVRGQMPYNNTHILTPAAPNFSTDFGASKQEFAAELWAVRGLQNPQTGPGGGIASVEWEQQGRILLGHRSGFWFFGDVIYHFQTAGCFTGGTVTASVHYAQGRQPSFLATSAVMPTNAGNRWMNMNWTDYDRDNISVGGAGTLTVDVPPGKDFWVRLSCGSDNQYLLVYSLAVEAEVAGPALVADLTGDCYVGLNDFAALAARWLECADVNNPEDCPGTPMPDAWTF